MTRRKIKGLGRQIVARAFASAQARPFGDEMILKPFVSPGWRATPVEDI